MALPLEQGGALANKHNSGQLLVLTFRLDFRAYANHGTVEMHVTRVRVRW